MVRQDSQNGIHASGSHHYYSRLVRHQQQVHHRLQTDSNNHRYIRCSLLHQKHRIHRQFSYQSKGQWLCRRPILSEDNLSCNHADLYSHQVQASIYHHSTNRTTSTTYHFHRRTRMGRYSWGSGCPICCQLHIEWAAIPECR